jgi:hypothetical protein
MNSQVLNYLYVFLVSIGIMNVLVMDEEVLVLLCWVLFVVLLYIYTCSAINIIFEEDRVKLYKDIVSSYNFQIKFLKILEDAHIIQTLTSFEVRQLYHFLMLETAKFFGKRQASFKFIIASQIEQKLFILLDKEAAVAIQAQDNINLKISFKVLKLFKSKNERVSILKAKILRESMTKFKTISSF